jgi:hypothetical protein
MAKKPKSQADPHGATPASGSDRSSAARAAGARAKQMLQDRKDGFIYRSADGRVTQEGRINPNTGKLEFPSVTLGPRPKPGSPESMLPSQSKPQRPKNPRRR